METLSRKNDGKLSPETYLRAKKRTYNQVSTRHGPESITPSILKNIPTTQQENEHQSATTSATTTQVALKGEVGLNTAGLRQLNPPPRYALTRSPNANTLHDGSHPRLSGPHA